MKGLMLKEYYLLKRYRKIYLLYILIFGAGATFTGNAGMYGAMAVIWMSTIPLSSFSMDEACKWDKMAVSSPVSRRQIVTSKYLVFVISALAAMVMTLIMVGVGTLINPGDMNFLESFVSVLAAMTLMGTATMILLPIVIKLGAEKGRMIMGLVFGLAFMIIMMMGAFTTISYNHGGQEQAIALMALVIMPLVMLVSGIISYLVSCKIYEKREL
ncbi:MAG: ABC-2 transporter permease [Angelakisella sp.]